MAVTTKVDFNYLGKSGIRVSNIGLGTMTFGAKTMVDSFFPYNIIAEDVSVDLMNKYAELGGNFIDTANFYQDGLSETILGKWLSGQERDRFIISTKAYFPLEVKEMFSRSERFDVNTVGLSRRNIIGSCEKSLERLQTDYIDLFQTHCWDPATPIDETLRGFDDLIRAGKVRNFGVSNVCGWQMQQVVDKIEMMGLSKCVSLQQQYNLVERQSELEEITVCRNNGIALLAWSPLNGGLLSGKYRRDKRPDSTCGRVGAVHEDETKALPSAPAWSKYMDDETYWTLIDIMSSIANKHGKSIPQVALRWLLQKDFVSSVIIGCTSVKQLEDNMGASSGWELSSEEMAALDTASPCSTRYPYSFIAFFTRERVNKFNKTYIS